ncbi:MAG: lipopolysaccharide kinase [Oligoflexia bacterium]|nr:lipopolysaccharide kinase [Oligoflexia bacterium]
MNQGSDRYIDEYQNVHIQDNMLGQGGQGVVYRTKDPDLAIKLVIDDNGNPLTDKASLEKYSKRFKRVRLLPLPEKLNITVPAALLVNNAGYVMQLLSEMIPLKHLGFDHKISENIVIEDIPLWLSKISENEAKKIVFYYKTGGLRRRLLALYKCASLLARLHGNGFVYGDISPNNIFISEDKEYSSVWLIDADNIRFEVTDGGNVVHTPKYGAPELVQCKDGCRPVSDCYAFAVVAFYLLSMIHPFIGKKVDGTDDADWADDENDDMDIEEKAYAGFFPWVDDQSDDSNASDGGLPRSLLLTGKLKTLFEKTFGSGRLSPWLRPSIYHWAEALAQATDTTVMCPSCNMSYYYDFINPETNEHGCPYCKTLRPLLIVIESYHWHGSNEPLSVPCWRYIREICDNSKISIPRRVFDSFSMADSDMEDVNIYLSEKEVLVKRSENSRINLSVAHERHQNGKFHKVYSQAQIDRNSLEFCFWLFAEVSGPRLISCSINGGGK